MISSRVLVNCGTWKVSHRNFKPNLNDLPVIHVLYMKARDQGDPAFGLWRAGSPTLGDRQTAKHNNQISTIAKKIALGMGQRLGSGHHHLL